MSRCRKCGLQYEGHRCKPCRKEYLLAYYAENKTIVAEKKAAYFQRTKEKWAEYGANYYTKNKDQVLAQCREYRAKNKVRINERHVQYRQLNPEATRQAVLEWKSRNAERLRVYNRNRKAKKAGANGALSAGLSERLFKLQRGKCACCGLPLGDDYHQDHILPLFLGGENVDANIQLLRGRCNLQKNKKHPVEFMQQRGFLL